MAAAALGHAARRLLGGGALRQQTQEAAVSRLSSRFAHTEVSCSKLDKDAVFEGIQKKTEELYDAAAELHQKYGVDAQDSACRTNRELLRQLTDHVSDRTGDPTWEWAKKEQATHDMLKLSGFVTMVLSGYACFISLAYGLKALKEKK